MKLEMIRFNTVVLPTKERCQQSGSLSLNKQEFRAGNVECMMNDNFYCCLGSIAMESSTYTPIFITVI